jgi:FkbM family methyltransferase
MLFDKEYLKSFLVSQNLNFTGCFHVGAHECEELAFYNDINIKSEDIVWLDAMSSKVQQANARGIPNVYNAVITDKDDDEVTFNVSNNVQSSSVLEFGTHLQEHPWVVFVDKLTLKTITVDSFFERNNLDASKYELWNFDIQGAELMALKGAVKSIKHVKALYLEVNEKELYKNCALIDEIDSFLSGYNFKRALTVMTPHGWGDALYIIDR